MRRFELKEGSASKFWEVTVSESTLTVRFGRIGSAGQEKSKTLATPALAQKEHDKLIAEKLGKGYKEVGDPSSDKAAAPATAAKTGRPAPQTADDILRGLRQCKPLERVARQLESLQRTSIRITAASAQGTPVGVSKLGGRPDLPTGASWPVRTVGGTEISLPFIAQFNLAELRPYDAEGLLPESGMLYFFYNREPYGPHGSDFLKPENWTVLYHAGADGNYAPATAPIPIPPHMDYGTLAVTFHNEVTLPDLESYYIGVPGNKTVKVELSTEEEEWDAYADLLYELRAKDNIHQMLGHADGVQPYTLENSYQDVRDVFFPGNSPFKSLSEEEQSEEIFQGRLLLQVSGEKSNKMEFGQGGRLFFFIREQDLKARDFSKVWVNEQ